MNRGAVLGLAALLSIQVTIMLILNSLFGCSANDDTAIRQVTVAEFKEHLDRDSSLALIDVRTLAEFESVRVPNIKARIDYHQIAEAIDTVQFPKDQPVYLICRSGRRSLIAAKELHEIGYKVPINVAGGTIAWDQAGYPLIKR